MPLSVLSDERLARMVGDGNERAFATLYTRYHQHLYRYCHSILRHEADAQDALQSAFTGALKALRRGQRDAPVRPWLFRIAHNESISLVRRRRPGAELPETLEAAGLSVEDAAESRQRLETLVSDLHALPDRQRGALVMRELSGLSHEELAQALGVSVGAAKQTVFEARQALQDFTEGRAMACDDVRRLVSDGDKRTLRGRKVRAHLRECGGCRSFAEAIPERRGALLALSPALPAAAASGLLGRVIGHSGAHHGSGGGGLLASAGGKSVGVVLSAKSVATGLAIVATATVGTVGAIEVVNHVGHPTVRAHLLKSDASHGSTSGRSSTAGHGRSGSKGAGRHGGGGAGHSGRGGAQSKRTSNSHRGGHGNSSSRHGSGASGRGHSGQGNGGSSATNSNAHGGNSNAHGGNPNAKGGHSGGSSNAGGTNPNAHGGNPNARGGNPNARGGNSNAHGGNPNHGGTNGNGKNSTGTSTTGNSNAHGGNPNHGGTNGNGNGNKGNGSSTTGNSNAHGGNPNAGGGNSHGH